MGEHKARLKAKCDKLEQEVMYNYAIVRAILEQAGPVTVTRERLNDVIKCGRQAVVKYDAEKDEYTFVAED